MLHGDREDRINRHEPAPPTGRLICPPEISAEVRAIWDYTAPLLSEMQIADAGGRDALLCYCEAVVLHRKASALLKSQKVLIEGLHGGPVRNPAIAIQRDAATVIRAFAQEFGLTPSARSQIVMESRTGVHGAERLLS
jgi:P27 family predicted phage terminase small subunit